MSSGYSKEEIAEIEELWASMDANKDGEISRDEIVAQFKLMEVPNELIERLTNEIIEKLDTDKNGKIDKNEFMQLLKMNKK